MEDQNLELTEREIKSLFNTLNENLPSKLSVRKMQFGRQKYFKQFNTILEDVKETNRSYCRFLIADYGSGKTHLVNGLFDHAKQNNFMVSKVDLSPNHLLYHADKGLNTYNLIMSKLECKGSTKAIEKMLVEIIKLSNKNTNGSMYRNNLSNQIRITLKFLESEPAGIILIGVIDKYANAYVNGDEVTMQECIRWIKGEFQTIRSANSSIQIPAIIDSENYKIYLNLITRLAKHIGYEGLVIFVDECVNIKDAYVTTRKKNYETILNIYNETTQEDVKNIIYFFIGDQEFLSSEKVGLFSYEALKTRLESENLEYVDLLRPVWYLPPLKKDEQEGLCKFIINIYALYHKENLNITDEAINNFISEQNEGFKAETIKIRDFISKFTQRLNKLYNGDETVESLFPKIKITSNYEGDYDF